MTVTFLEVVKAACPELSEAEILERDKRILNRKIKAKHNKNRITHNSGSMEDYPHRISLAEMAKLIPLSHCGIRDKIRLKGITPVILCFKRKCYTITRKEFKEVFGA